MSKELKPCPFCGEEAQLGKEAQLVDEGAWGIKAYYIICCVQTYSSNQKECAIECWNRRV